MAQRKDFPSYYPCLMQKDGIRRVEHPHDERSIIPPVSRDTRLRRALARVAAAVRA